jgi:LacI family transcriptional regulator
MIIAPPQDAEDQLRQLQKQRVPFVLVDRYFPGLDSDYVVLDNFQASFNAVDHILARGRKRVGMIGYETSLAHLRDRKSGYLASLKANGISFRKSWLKEVAIGNNKLEIEDAVKQLLSLKTPVDSILFASNTIATHAVKYINSLPVKVPDELSLLCFDETEALDLFYAPLTYIRQPLEQMGQLAIQTLLEKLNKKSGLKQFKVQGELVVRKSG